MSQNQSPSAAAQNPPIGESRREFVDRLRRASLFVAPAVVAIGLTAPRAASGY